MQSNLSALSKVVDSCGPNVLTLVLNSLVYLLSICIDQHEQDFQSCDNKHNSALSLTAK